MAVSPHFSHRFEPRGVAHALLRAASPLLPTPGLDTMLLAGDGVEMSLDTARMSARMSAQCHLVFQVNEVIKNIL
jgi:hypothetical protein